MLNFFNLFLFSAIMNHPFSKLIVIMLLTVCYSCIQDVDDIPIYRDGLTIKAYPGAQAGMQLNFEGHTYTIVDRELLIEKINNAEDLSRVVVTQLTDMSQLFLDSPYAEGEVFDHDIGSWDVSNVIDMSQLFKGLKNFNSDISNWNVSNVQDMSELFSGAEAFNQDLSNWNVESVTDMDRMFYEASTFNQFISDWNTSKVVNMNRMFYKATSFDQDLSRWCVSLIASQPFGFDFEANSWTKPRPNWGTCDF